MIFAFRNISEFCQFAITKNKKNQNEKTARQTFASTRKTREKFLLSDSYLEIFDSVNDIINSNWFSLISTIDLHQRVFALESSNGNVIDFDPSRTIRKRSLRIINSGRDNAKNFQH